MLDVRQRVRDFVSQNFYVPDTAALDDEASLLQQGVVDSTGILEVILFLEETFDIRVEDSEITPQNMDSVSRIAAFVISKRESVAA
jgi:acyl carrier protein